MELKQIITKSRSYRKFDERHVIPEKVLRDLVELARLSPSARNQQALKFKLSNTAEMNGLIFPALRWAGFIKDWGGPKKGERPSAYIIVVGDERISRDFSCDHGIAAQSILLGAVEKGLGGCMLASVDRDLLRESLGISEDFRILLVIALGKPVEKVVLEDMAENGSIKYYRDKKDIHHVPKRLLEDLIIR